MNKLAGCSKKQKTETKEWTFSESCYFRKLQIALLEMTGFIFSEKERPLQIFTISLDHICLETSLRSACQDPAF